MPQDAKKAPQGRPVPLNQRQVDAMVRSGAESAEVHRLIESHAERNPVKPVTAERPGTRTGGKGEPRVSTPKEAARLQESPLPAQAKAVKPDDSVRGARPEVDPPR